MKIGGARSISCSSSFALDLLQVADTEKPFLGEVYDGRDTLVEKTAEIIT